MILCSLKHYGTYVMISSLLTYNSNIIIVYDRQYGTIMFYIIQSIHVAYADLGSKLSVLIILNTFCMVTLYHWVPCSGYIIVLL